MELVVAEPDAMVTLAKIVRFMAVVVLIGGKLPREIISLGELGAERPAPLFDFDALVTIPDSGFAVIHDEPHLTIVYDEGEFKGEIVDATLEKLDRAREIAAQYNLVIDHVRCDYYTNFILHLKQKEDAPQ